MERERERKAVSAPVPLLKEARENAFSGRKMEDFYLFSLKKSPS